MKQSIIGLLTKVVFFASSLAVAAEAEWPGIKVHVEASKPVTAANKGDGFELVITREEEEIHLGVFNWSDSPKEYELAAFGKPEPVRLEARHSLILKYDGKDSFEEICQNLLSK